MAALLVSAKYNNLSINKMIAIHAPASDGNDVPAYQRYVHGHTGLDMKRKMNSLTADELASVRHAMEALEGYSDPPGNETMMKVIEAVKSTNDINYTDFKVSGRWISLAEAMTMVQEDKLDAVISGGHLSPSPGQPSFSSIEIEPSDKEEGENPKHKDKDDDNG